MADFIGGIVEFFSDLISSVADAVGYLTSGVSTILGAAAVFPSIWSVLPGSFTGFIVAIVAVALGTSLLLAFLRR